MLKALSAAVTLAFALTPTPALSARLIEPTSGTALAPTNQAGDHLYFVLLRTDKVRELGDSGEAPPVNPRALKPNDDPRAWHRADVRKMVKLIEADYGISAVNMTSWAAPALTAYFNQAAVNRLLGDPRIDYVELVAAAPRETDFSSSPPWSDTTSGSEHISWGKVAMDMNDNVTPTKPRVHGRRGPEHLGAVASRLGRGKYHAAEYRCRELYSQPSTSCRRVQYSRG